MLQRKKKGNRPYAFRVWNQNHEKFEASHARHHRYTLLLADFIQPTGPWEVVKETWRIARGRFAGEWEVTLYPEDEPELRRPAVRWARVLLAGHGGILVISLLFGWWIVPVLFSLSPFYGGWLFFLCNKTQHIGLEDEVPDFRLCCRTFTLSPVVRFLYWQINYHTEHHMYAAVPCYHLKELHNLIKHDLPPCRHGLAAVWKEIAEIQFRQERDPSYRHEVVLPSEAAPARR